ncbi:MAG: hypothetical protein PUP46_01805 [Endozoicomonas sp. (ex Botrylloides leachii)]|nr:hypothetical protein [Endozoicomonas sp. (ex Botrylloides leachii)]
MKNTGALIINLLLLASAVIMSSLTLASERITSHNALEKALRDNSPPSGYIDLSSCTTEAVVGNIPEDKQTYRLSFKDHFSFNLESKVITSVFDTVLNNSQIINSKPILVTVSATVFVTSIPTSNHLRYQITIKNDQKHYIRVYECPWKQAVYLWRQ